MTDGSVRLARLRDLPSLVALYRSQLVRPPRKLTPFPFGRLPLGAILLLVLASRPLYPLVRRLAPRLAMWIVVAVAPGDGAIVGLGFLHLVHDRDGRPLGRTGLLVDADHRRAGWGTRIKLELMRLCLRVGIPRMQAFHDPRNLDSISVSRRLGFSLRDNGPDDPVRPMGRYLVSEGDVARLLATRDASPPAPLPR